MRPVTTITREIYRKACKRKGKPHSGPEFNREYAIIKQLIYAHTVTMLRGADMKMKDIGTLESLKDNYSAYIRKTLDNALKKSMLALRYNRKLKLKQFKNGKPSK
jgi:hypothetical protein